MHTALFRKRVFADITKDLKIVLDYRDGPQTLVREAERGLRRGGQEVVWGLRQRRGPWPLAQQAPQTLEPPDAGRGRKHPPLQPREGQRPCRHLAFGLLASRAERHAISVVGSLQPSVGAAPSPRTLRTPACMALPPAPCRLPPRAPRLLWLQTRVHVSPLETLSGTGHLKPQGSGAHTGLSPRSLSSGPYPAPGLCNWSLVSLGHRSPRTGALTPGCPSASPARGSAWPPHEADEPSCPPDL